MPSTTPQLGVGVGAESGLQKVGAEIVGGE
jgi:hypothetical protein